MKAVKMAAKTLERFNKGKDTSILCGFEMAKKILYWLCMSGSTNIGWIEIASAEEYDDIYCIALVSDGKLFCEQLVKDDKTYKTAGKVYANKKDFKERDVNKYVANAKVVMK